MPASKLPSDEPERLASLQKMKILDTPIEARFERVTRLACRSFNVPISAISLIDEDRQWFKSVQGLETTETSRDVSFCSHAILGEEVFVVEDSHADERFRENPLVLGTPNIRFYAGCPVRNTEGHKIGTLCLLDSRPREFDADDEVALRDLARMVEDEFKLQPLHATQSEFIQELDRAFLAASVDPLTRIWNRSAITEILERDLVKCPSGGAGMGLLMLVFDRLGALSDKDRDAVLRQGAARMVGTIRAADAIGRYDDDRFVVALTECYESGVEAVGERLRAIVEASPITGSDMSFGASVSVGGAWCPGGMTTAPENLIALAAAAARKAQAKGHNRVEMSRYVD